MINAAEALFAWLAERPRSDATNADWGREVRMCYRNDPDGLWFGVTLTNEKGGLHDAIARTRDRAILLALQAARTGKRSLTEP